MLILDGPMRSLPTEHIQLLAGRLVSMVKGLAVRSINPFNAYRCRNSIAMLH